MEWKPASIPRPRPKHTPSESSQCTGDSFLVTRSQDFRLLVIRLRTNSRSGYPGAIFYGLDYLQRNLCDTMMP